MKIVKSAGTKRTIAQMDKRLSKMAGRAVNDDKKPNGFLSRKNHGPATGRKPGRP